jgi:nitrogen fixation protein NifZ
MDQEKFELATDTRFDYGDQVRLIRSIRNDGSMMGSDRGDLVVRRGSIGFIKSIGKLLMDQVIYQVHFLDQGITIGCRDTEVGALDDPWIERLFERDDKVSVQVSLASGGETVVAKGQVGTVLGAENKELPITYRVNFERDDGVDYNAWVIPESVLKLDETAPMVRGRS